MAMIAGKRQADLVYHEEVNLQLRVTDWEYINWGRGKKKVGAKQRAKHSWGLRIRRSHTEERKRERSVREQQREGEKVVKTKLEPWRGVSPHSLNRSSKWSVVCWRATERHWRVLRYLRKFKYVWGLE
jgi:hypothetical protein